VLAVGVEAGHGHGKVGAFRVGRHVVSERDRVRHVTTQRVGMLKAPGRLDGRTEDCPVGQFLVVADDVGQESVAFPPDVRQRDRTYTSIWITVNSTGDSCTYKICLGNYSRTIRSIWMGWIWCIRW